MPRIHHSALDKSRVYSRLMRLYLGKHAYVKAAALATASYYKQFGELPYRFERPNVLEFADKATPDIFAALKDMSPAQAVDYLRSKGIAVTSSYKDMDARAHQKAFTVAKVASAKSLQAIREQLVKALESGQTFADFKANVAPTLLSDGKVLSPARLQNVFRNNVQSAMAAGRKQQMDDTKADFPYRQYVAVTDDSTTELCDGLNGKVFRADDPFWDKYTPPNHHGCRAGVRSMTDMQLLREDLKVEEGKDYEHLTAEAKAQGFDTAPSLLAEPEAVDTAAFDPDVRAALEQQLEQVAPPQPVDWSDDNIMEAEAGLLDNKNVILDVKYFDALNQHLGNLKPSEVLDYLTCEGPTYTNANGSFKLQRINGRVRQFNNQSTSITSNFEAKLPNGTTGKVNLIRDFHVDSDGNRWVYHNYMVIDSNLQRAGIAKDIWRNSLAGYERMGVQRIEVTAALDGGHHTWGKFGFDFATDAYRLKWRTAFSTHLQSKGVSEREANLYVTRLHEPRDFQRLHAVDDIEVDGDAWKRNVYMEPWKGVLRLDDKTATGYKTLQRYLSKD